MSEIFNNAFDVAVAERAANVFGRFWEMRELLYQRQDEWSSLDTMNLRMKLIEYAGTLGIDETQFVNEFDNTRNRDAVIRDGEKAIQCEMQGVPTSVLLIPKDRISEETLRRVAIPAFYMLGENETYFAVVITGAQEYGTFNDILRWVRY